MKIGIIGLGFVGLLLDAFLNFKKYKVYAVDSDKKKVLKIKSRAAPFYEPKLEKLVKKALKLSLGISTNTKVLVEKCDLICITVGAPILKNGHIDLTHLKKAKKQIGLILKKTENKPIIAIKSTVIPGTNRIIQKILEKNSKKKLRAEYIAIGLGK